MFCRLPRTADADLERFRAMIAKTAAGEVSRAEFRAFRVPNGVYEQRTPDRYMLRVRCPGGALEPDAMRGAARVSRSYGHGAVHVTTRQEIQIHDVGFDDLHPALVALHAAGLSTKGGGGNTVRNITACERAGVCVDECFDISPYPRALTELLLDDPLSLQLPRKFKIAFSGCGHDCAGATVSDLGFVAKEQDGVPGFAVYVAGGLGAKSRVAALLEPFVAADQCYRVCEALKRVFDKHGDRRNRGRARLRFLAEKIGLEELRRLYLEEFAALDGVADEAARLRPVAGPPVSIPVTASSPAPGFERWRERNVVSQRQAGFVVVHVPLRNGDIEAAALEQLADVVERFSEGVARATTKQNLLLCWVPEAALPALHRELDRLRLASAPLPVVRNAVACAGASTCRLGICHARGLSSAVIEAIEAADLDLGAAARIDLHISGCPNNCGRHSLGSIGLFGAVRRIDGQAVPHYCLQLGGRHRAGATRLAEGKFLVPARRAPRLVVSLLEAFRASPHYPDFDAFVVNGGREVAHGLAAREALHGLADAPDAAVDWGATKPFSLAGRSAGECGAGVFDLIEVDLENARDALDEGRLYAATVLSSRALLVTRGHDPQGEQQALELFARDFIDGGLIDANHGALIDAARAAGGVAGFFEAQTEAVRGFVDAVRALYDNMDPSLRFGAKTPGQPAAIPACDSSRQPTPLPAAAASARAGSPQREADPSNLSRPLDDVKTKTLVDRIRAGKVRAILVTPDGAMNVPENPARDGRDATKAAQEQECRRAVCGSSAGRRNAADAAQLTALVGTLDFTGAGDDGAQRVLRAVFERFGARGAIGTSLQHSGMVLIDMAARLELPFRIFTIDTLRLHEETLRHIERVEAHYGIAIERFTPDPGELARMLRQHGEHLFFDSVAKRQYCCRIRKEVPNDRALQNIDAWITGLRRDQSSGRAQTPLARVIERNGRPILKVAPLAGWTEAQVVDYVERRAVPVNSLYAQGYASIGCVICTSPVLAWEDRRSGRWRWEKEAPDKECGLHLESGAGI